MEDSLLQCTSNQHWLRFMSWKCFRAWQLYVLSLPPLFGSLCVEKDQWWCWCRWPADFLFIFGLQTKKTFEVKLNTRKIIWVFHHLWLSCTLIYHCTKTFKSIPWFGESSWSLSLRRSKNSWTILELTAELWCYFLLTQNVGGLWGVPSVFVMKYRLCV